MKKFLIMSVCFLVVGSFGITASAQKDGSKKSGEAMFNEHCAMCHPDGGNIITPGKTLLKKDLAANSIKTPEDIVKIMRNPGPGMTKFDVKTILDKDAKDIAEYVIKKFK